MTPPDLTRGRSGGSLLVFLLAAVATALCGCADLPPRTVVPPVEARPRLLDILHYDIAVDLDHAAGRVDGRLDVHVTGLPGARGDKLVLDAVEMVVQGVWDEAGEDLPWTLEHNRLVVDLAAPVLPGERAIISVDYACYPRRGLLFVRPSGPDTERPWHIWTQGQSEDTRHWVPVHDASDELATHSLALTVDQAFTTMAAGELTSSVEHARTARRTDTWEMTVPHASYLLTFVAGGLAVGELAAADGMAGSVALPVLAEPRHLEKLLQNAADTADMLTVLERHIGVPYPHGKYAQCCVKSFTAGGMENVSATTLYYELIHHPDDEPQLEERDLLAHELAHQWFGDLLTCANWSHIWLNEGFATYYEALYRRAKYGQDAFLERMTDNTRAWLDAELDHSHALVWDDWDIPDDVFDTHAYEGGATRLHLLSAMLGPDVFTAAIRDWTARHAGQEVVTADLRASIEASTGKDLARFFEEWVHGTGFPELVVAADGRGLVIRQVQGQRGWREVFHAPVELVFSRGGEAQRMLVELDAAEQHVTLPGSGPITWFHLDASAHLPGHVMNRQDEDAWRAMLSGAPDGFSRLIAAQWFAGYAAVRADDEWPVTLDDGTELNDPVFWQADADSVTALISAARSDNMPSVRTAAMEALLGTVHPRVVTAFEELASDADPRVRQVAMHGLSLQGGDMTIPMLVDATADPNASVAAAALAGLARCKHPGVLALGQHMIAAADDLRWRLVRDVLVTLAPLDDPAIHPLLIGLAQTHPVPRIRADAVRALAGQQDRPFEDVTWRTILGALADPEFLVRDAAVTTLARWGDPAAVVHLRAQAAIEPDATVLGALRDALSELD